MKVSIVLLAVLLGVALGGGLDSYNIDLSETTVSGLSAGGFMASQLHYAFSENIKGAAIFAGGPFYCAKASMTTATTACMSVPISISTAALELKASQLASKGEIDSLDNLKDSKVYLYSGTKDTVVKTGVMKAAEKMYEKYGADVVTEFTVPSEHCFPTDDFGKSCGHFGSPYINNCDYNGAEKAFTQLYGDLKPTTTQNTDNLIEFDQTAYFTANKSISMGSKGYVYVPTACQNGEKCKLHISLHGCQMTLADIGTQYITKIGINEIAEANNIVVLYPQVKKSILSPLNPEGCFDWWGYTTPGVLPIANSDKYTTKSGPQMAAIWGMAQDLAGSQAQIEFV